MQSVKVSSKGQIVIPKALRESRHITAGSEFVIFAVGDELRLTPAPAFPKTLVRDAAGILRRAGRKPLAADATKRAIGKMIGARDKATQGR